MAGGELIGRLLPGGHVNPASPVIVLLNPVDQIENKIDALNGQEPTSAGATINFRSGTFDKAVALLSPGESIRFRNQDQDPRLIFGYEKNAIRHRFFLPVSGSSIPIKTPVDVSITKWVDQGSSQFCWVYVTDALWRKTLSGPGEFRFAGTPDGQYELIVSDLLFRNISRKVQIQDGRLTSVVSFQQTDKGLSWVD